VNKRGLSPVVASVLLIFLVLVLASLIFLWARGFISEQVEKFGQPIEDLCASIDYDAGIADRVGGQVTLEVVNRGDVNIHHLDIKMVGGGNSEIGQFDFPVDAGGAISDDVYLRMENGDTPDEVVVYPALVGTVKGKHSNKVFTCNDQGKTLLM